MSTSEPEQLELPLEYPPVDHYTVTIARGPLHNEQIVRTSFVTAVEDAISTIEAWRDTYNQREAVSWADEEVDAYGRLYGVGPQGEVWLITVVPPLSVELTS